MRKMKFKPVLLHFKFDNFAGLPSEIGDVTKSEVLLTDCNGHQWYLEIYPGGCRRASEPGWTSVCLRSYYGYHASRRTFSVEDANGDTVIEIEKRSAGSAVHLLKRSEILDGTKNILKDGALLIDVTVQVKDHKDHLFQPPSEHTNKMLNLLATGEKSDTSFIVEGKVFHAHSQIIYAHAPILANHCGGSINNILPEVFQQLLEHIYSGRPLTEYHILKYGQELIDAANRYELVELKMSVENVLVRERIITTKNVCEYILFADAQSCPLLKEYAISFFSAHCRKVLKSEHSRCLKDSGDLMSEIMLLMNPGNEDSDDMDVNELRKEFGKRKLNVDGSKDALISRLEDAKRQRTE